MFAECSTNFLTRLVFSSPLSTGRTHLLSVTRETKFIPHEQCVKHALYHLVSFFFFHLCLDRSCTRYRFPYFVRTFSSFLLPLQLITHLILVNIFDFFFLYRNILKRIKKLKDRWSLSRHSSIDRLTRFCYSKFSSKIESIESSYPLGKKGTDRKGASGYIDSQLGYRATFISVFRVYMYIHIYLLWPFQLFIWSSWWLKQNERQTYTTGGNWYP